MNSVNKYIQIDSGFPSNVFTSALDANKWRPKAQCLQFQRVFRDTIVFIEYKKLIHKIKGSYPPGSLVVLRSSQVRVERFLAEGGYAHVYQVTLLQSSTIPPGSNAVLKRIACADETALKDLEREIEHHVH